MAFQNALSGLNAAQTELDVIGNNIANAETSGFKRSRTEFADVYASALVDGGSNQAGGGVRISSISQQFSQGGIEFTENGLDLAINGDGFFRLENSGEIVYSRSGSFGVDKDGYVVNKQGMRLTGYDANDQGQLTGSVEPLMIESSNAEPNATSRVDAKANLDSRQDAPTAPFDPNDPDTYNNVTSTSIYDEQGNPHLMDLYFVKDSANPNEWDMYTYVNGTDVGGGPTNITFNSDGTLNTGGLTSIVGWDPGNGASIQDFDIDLAGSTQDSDSTQYGADFGVYELDQDGYTTGQLSGVDVDDSGRVFARYTNGQSRVLGQVALASFSNPQGLSPAGDSTWTETYASGTELLGTPGSTSLGVIQSGALETSNVDVSKELVDMITAQRNYQANAKMITTEDEVTQTIINIR